MKKYTIPELIKIFSLHANECEDSMEFNLPAALLCICEELSKREKNE